MIKHLILLKIQIMLDNMDLLHWSINFLIKKLLVEHLKMNLLKMKYCKELAEELHKQIIRKFKKRKVHSSFTDNI